MEKASSSELRGENAPLHRQIHRDRQNREATHREAVRRVASIQSESIKSRLMHHHVLTLSQWKAY